ncbi:hypothetical protein pb186bvf_000561 [Paramecium bursaria]
MTGLYLENVQFSLKKMRIIDGQVSLTQIGQNLKSKYNGCYGAELVYGQKCLTCQDVVIAHAQRGWTILNIESIAQCMPDGVAKVPYDTHQQDLFNYFNDKQDQELKQIQETLENVKLDQNDEQNQSDEQDSNIVMKEIMSEDQKSNFKQALSELSEIGFNPMQWDQNRLKEEKVKRVDSLINMLNISLDSIGKNQAQQIKFADREKVTSYKYLPQEFDNLTEIYRQKCDQNVIIYLNITKDNQEEQTQYELELAPKQCSIYIQYRVVVQEQLLTIQIQLQNQTVSWDIPKRKSLLNTLMMQIEDLQVVDREYNYSYKPKSMLDKHYNLFRLNIYVPIATQKRILFMDSFQTTNNKQTDILPEYVQDIEEHINEGCQFFGHFHIKKVPGIISVGFSGRGQAAQFIKKNFTLNHTINEFYFSDDSQTIKVNNQIVSPLNGYISQNLELDQQNYYLKIVSSKLIDSNQQESQFYTFTALKSKSQLKNEELLPKFQFQYDFDPISMLYKECTYGDYIVVSLAIFGGLLAFSTYIQRFLSLYLL